MIAFVGDIHYFWRHLRKTLDQIPQDIEHIITVGDLDVYPDDARSPHGQIWLPIKRPLMFIDGNHHHFPTTRGLAEPTQIRPNLTYLPRGTVLELDGRKIGFLGGGDSVMDMEYRSAGFDWWHDEAVTDADLAKFDHLNPGDIDLLITHTPPAVITQEMKGSEPHPSAVKVERLWRRLGEPELICGHMHHSYTNHNVQVLNMFEVTYR